MLRQLLYNNTRALRSSARPTRAFSISSAMNAEGATGATRSGGIAQSDSFNKREKANEDLYVRQKEREKLMILKAKLAEQQAHLAELSKHIDDIAAASGGQGERN